MGLLWSRFGEGGPASGGTAQRFLRGGMGNPRPGPWLFLQLRNGMYCFISPGTVMKKIFLAVSLLPALQAVGWAEPGPCECRRCIAAYGDSRSGNEAHKKIAALIKAAHPQAVIHVGDMVPTGADPKDWETFKAITKELRAGASFYAVMGNHEEGGENIFTGLFRYPGSGRWYREDVRGIRFIMLDYLSPLEKGGKQFKWLEKELQAPVGSNKFKIVVMHKPLFSTGQHSKAEWKPAADLEKLFREQGVAMVLAGDDHDYERLEKDGLVQVVTGGGGAELRPQSFKSPYSRIFASVNHYCLISVCGDTLRTEVFDIKNKLIDSFELKAEASGSHRAGN